LLYAEKYKKKEDFRGLEELKGLQQMLEDKN
jgi:hypothetical protein